MTGFSKTKYHLQSLCCGTALEDQYWELYCPNKSDSGLLRAVYDSKQLSIDESLPGLYQFSSWLPICKTLNGSAAPVTYKSVGLAKKLGLNNLYITFNGYWPEKGAFMSTGTFKECEAFTVCARVNKNPGGVLVVASAGNTARAFAKVCSENKIPVLIVVPEDNLDALWFEEEIDSCVKLIAAESGGDYFDAIHLSNLACQTPGFYPEGGSKNVARRDGMGVTVLSAVSTIGKIPDYYFQAIGSGTGAIAAWEANLRFLEDGRYGSNKMRLMLSQNAPFLPIKDAWDIDSRELLPCDDAKARHQVELIAAKVLSNRKPTYCTTGGLYDAMKDAGGDIFAVTNEEGAQAAELFLDLEGNDLEPAAAVAVASLIQAVNDGLVERDSTIMLNVTGGGIIRFKQEHEITYLKPQLVFPLSPDPQMVQEKIKTLFQN